MSRIGRMPIPVPPGVDITIEDGLVTVKGPKGTLAQHVPTTIRIAREDSNLVVARDSDAAMQRALHGLTRTLVANMVIGVTQGFRKSLDIAGVGYRGALEGKDLVLQVGYSHPVRMTPPEGIAYALETPTRVVVTGIDKQVVGAQAAKIRAVRPPEPYKGKGIRYTGEVIRRKAGKAGKVGGKK